MNEVPEEKVFELHIPSRADRLRLVRRAVRTAAELSGCSPRCSEDLVIAVNEACMNVIQHGYGDREGDIIVEVGRTETDVIVRLIDFCPSVEPARVKPREIEKEIDEMRPGGLGLHLIEEVMDRADFLPPPPGAGNLLQMIKKIA